VELARRKRQRARAQEDVLAKSVLDVAQELCRTIAADGEGATRLMTVQVPALRPRTPPRSARARSRRAR
jgi:N-acetylglutamate synthase/N-acetylornithine aminotransferase